MSPSSSFESKTFMYLVDAANSLVVSTGHDDTSVSSSDSMNASQSPVSNCASSQIIDNSCTSCSKKQNFAETLMCLLLDEEYSKVVTFLPDNQSFGIINAKRFSDEVMPKVFNIRTFSSFVRKLNRWGFERIMEKKTHDVDVFRHTLFHKNDWKLCSKIKCVGHLSKQEQERLSTSLQTPMRSLSSMMSKARPIMVPPSPILQARALHDVTSQVVRDALDALRRDETVTHTLNDAKMQQLLARQHLRAQMMAMRAACLFA